MRSIYSMFWVLTLIIAPAAALASQVPTAKAQIAGALSAAPEDRREGATVLGYSEDGEFIDLREGSNEMICLADDPSDDRFHVTCYHSSLEPYIARGRELKAEGLDGTERLDVRHKEADDGNLEMPSSPATLYNLGGDLEIFNATTGEVSGGNWVWSVYIPYATEDSTGLPTTPQLAGAPWIMRPGTASSHIMVVQPREPAPEGDE